MPIIEVDKCQMSRPSRFREGGKAGHIFKLLKSIVGSRMRYVKGGPSRFREGGQGWS